jgi:hypothetical protein
VQGGCDSRPGTGHFHSTAKPFATVFVDPTDAEGTFPKDFLISLPFPDGYMGAGDFHDIGDPVPEGEQTYSNSNVKAHVRLLNKDHANNPIEADHSQLKHRLRPMRGLRTDRTAQTIIAGHAFMQNLRRGHYELAVDAPSAHRVAVAFAELAQAI